MGRENLFNDIQNLSSKLMRTYNRYQPEIHGLFCVFKYYKLFSFLNFFEMKKKLNLTENLSSRSFYPFSDVNDKGIVKLTLWHCTKVYLFSFAVRFFEIMYIS